MSAPAREPLPPGDARHRRLALKLALAALAMVGFGYLLVPLYQVYCRVTGLNGTTDVSSLRTALARKTDPARIVTVELVANTAAGLPWAFAPQTPRLRVHPGELVLTTFQARNLGSAAITGQAIPSVTPGEAAPHFHKIECFCFTRQPLAPGEAKTLPLQFQVDAELPPQIGTLTLSYTFFALPAEIAAPASTAPAPVSAAAPAPVSAAAPADTAATPGY